MKMLVFALFLCGCASSPKYDAHNDCEPVNVAGDTKVIVVYRMDGAWWLADPDNVGTIIPPKNIRFVPGSDVVLVAFDDGSGEIKVRKAESFYEHGNVRGYCLK